MGSRRIEAQSPESHRTCSTGQNVARDEASSRIMQDADIVISSAFLKFEYKLRHWTLATIAFAGGITTGRKAR